MDRTYQWRWRMANILAAVLIIVSVLIPVAQNWLQQDRYRLSADALSLVGQTDASLAKQLTYDSTKQLYQFNKDQVETGNKAGLPAQLQKASVGASNKSNTKTYALDVAKDFSKGVTYHDVNSQLSFSMSPLFKALPAQTEQGHVVFPLDGGNQAIYTLKNNGLKEDIVVPKTTTSTMQFSYTLNLPKSLEARVIPDSGGAIGIYSADQVLFGDISYSSPDDQQRVEKAREVNAKTQLVFGLPAPVIKAANGGSIGSASARFSLSGNRLSVIAEGLAGITTPITIDPSVVVTSTSDFLTAGNNEGNIDFATSGLINRGAVTGAAVSTGWNYTHNSTNDSTTYVSGFTTARDLHGSVVYGGYLYILGGDTGSGKLSDVQYAALNSDGTIGTWATAASGFTTARSNFTALGYNGYLYIVGGLGASGNLSDIQSAPIGAAGAPGAWSSAGTSLGTGTYGAGVAVYNNFLYVLGGATGAGNVATVQYAPLNADGTVGSFTSTTSFTTARFGGIAIAYNSYLYLLGGDSGNGSSGATLLNDVQYAKINTNGTVGTWTTTTSFTTTRGAQTATLYNGYLYVIGGYNSSLANLSDVQYAQINANGTVGAWATTASFNTARFGQGAVAYNGYLYSTGGGTGTSARLSDVQYAKIDPAGSPATFSVYSSAYATARKGISVVAYGGYLYVMNGEAGGSPSASGFFAPFKSDGTVDTVTGFSSTGGSSNRAYSAAFAYNGYMYVFGGCTTTLSTCTTATNNIATVYSSPINNSNGVLGTFVAQTSFTTARYGLTAVVYNGYAYVMGGLNGSTFQSDVQSAPLGASGAITTWTTQTSFAIPTARAGFATATYGGYVYIGGGCSAGNLTTCTTRQNDIQYAKFDNAGSFSATWASTSSFTNARYGLGMTVLNGYLYIGGGYNGTTYYNDTQYAKIGTTGSLSAWASGASFTNAEWGGGMVAYNGYLYQAGGWNGTTYYRDVYYGSLSNGGQNVGGAWTTNATDITGPYGATGDWNYGQMFAANGFLYMVGGYTSTPSVVRHDDVYYAPIAINGSVGSWTLDSDHMVSNHYQFGLAVYNGYVYVVGGQTGTNPTSDIEYAAIDPAGGTKAWTKISGATLGTARAHVSVAAYNGYLYMTGGLTSGGTEQNDVQYAPVNADGSVGSWHYTHSSTDDGTSFVSGFTTARNTHATVAYNNYLYIMGGTDGTNNLSDVQYAPLNSNGTVGTWAFTTSLVYTRKAPRAFAYNGFIYMVTGTTTGVTINRMDSVPVNANGTLGTWQTAPVAYTGVRQYSGMTVYNGNVYFAGGSNGATAYLDLQYAPLPVMPKTGRYSKLVDLGAPQNVTGVAYNGTMPNVLGVTTFRYAGTNGVFGAAGDASATVACTSSTLNFTRYISITILLDDSQSGGGAFPDLDSSDANVTDFTINYTVSHPAPNIRLRHGQTLQAGTLAPLDTCV